MDQKTLVKAGHQIIIELEKQDIQIRGAMWVHLPEIDSWRLWVVGPKGKDASYKKEFYGAVANALPEAQKIYQGITMSDIELKFDNDRNIQAISMMMRVEGSSSVQMSRNMVNGVYTPDGVLLRMAL